MKDVAKEKYLKLMTQVEDLEDELEAKQQSGADAESIKATQEALADAKHELARVSDGCGTGRNPAG